MKNTVDNEFLLHNMETKKKIKERFLLWTGAWNESISTNWNVTRISTRT